MKDSMQKGGGFYNADACDLGEFKRLIERTTGPSSVPHAAEIQSNIPIYDMTKLRAVLADGIARPALLGEWAQVLRKGAGTFALKGAYADTRVLDEATVLYQQIIAREKLGSGGAGDHFAAAGANDRIWNSLQKLCEASPEVFLRYFANPAIAGACEAWLGPNYQMSAQVNLVYPGGAAQQAHRDYHLGFQSAKSCATYPAHAHELTAALTLQGAVAHCDMPIESGPTKLLPFSQTYLEGYMAWRRDDFRAAFEDAYVQIPLQKGDALFFNPAIFHAAGANTSGDIDRMANLLQVSSAFGRAMETIDRTKMCKLIYPHALAAKNAGTLSSDEMDAAIGASAEGYSFPTNLDHDQPKDGVAPETQAALMRRALQQGMGQPEFDAALDQIAVNRRA